jgi:hypothetical protein
LISKARAGMFSPRFNEAFRTLDGHGWSLLSGLAKGYQGTGEQVNLLLQPRQPLPGILDFGQPGVSDLLSKLNLTFHLFVIYPPPQRDEPKEQTNAHSSATAEKEMLILYI